MLFFISHTQIYESHKSAPLGHIFTIFHQVNNFKEK